MLLDNVCLFGSVQEENKVNAGSVEAIEEHPQNSDQVCVLLCFWKPLPF